ncbi:epsin-1-like isoform X1 [Chlorella sorokiniana]|uniref:Epsin-1-like isoform X1 n=1 Tax=Chlorella sorokiniana TaxID=3076 RepID=A0A2P6TU80_CHLSO|nr:epsin-1-like isoform X1 [Chlorella sorokiniana]|eukprot:PRW57625.1 epsin-1-like isoform X1 [Chlorella sorokiniana]
MGLFSLCCGGAGATKGEEHAPLWAPLPGERRNGGGGGGGRAGAAGLPFGAGALRYDPFASSYDAHHKKAARRDEPNPFAFTSPPPPPSDDPFAPSQQPAAGSWASEPGYLKEQALLAAHEAGTQSPPSDKHHWFGLGHSSSPSPPPAAAPQPSRARQRQPAGQQRAPAFGEGALTKWH